MLVLAANLLVAGRLTWTPGGYALSFGRMLQDGIVKKYLDDHCPDPSLHLCAYKDQLPHDADEFFWGGDLFTKLGRFAGLATRCAGSRLTALPIIRACRSSRCSSETAKQLIEVDTGAGVVKWVWDSYAIIKNFAPRSSPAMRRVAPAAAANSTSPPSTALQVPARWLAMALLPVIALLALRRKGFGDIGELAAAAALALFANAAVFGTLATAHNRYGARMIWLAAFRRHARARPPDRRTAVRASSPRLAALSAVRQTIRERCFAILFEGYRPMADAAVLQQLAPTGKLRIAIAVAPSPSAQFAIKDAATGAYRGVAVILGTALAKKLGVPAELIVHNGSGEIQNSAADNKWDVAFLPVDEERKKFVDFGNAYHLLQSTYLVGPCGQVRLGRRRQRGRHAHRRRRQYRDLPHLQQDRAQRHPCQFRQDRCRGGGAARAARSTRWRSRASRSPGWQPKVPGSRILDGGFLNSTTSVAVPKGKPAALAYATAFIEEAKASGLVRQAFDEMGLKSSVVAPAGMKS